MIISVVDEFKFSPATVGDFYLDSTDYKGLGFWYNAVLESARELKKMQNKR